MYTLVFYAVALVFYSKTLAVGSVRIRVNARAGLPLYNADLLIGAVQHEAQPDVAQREVGVDAVRGSRGGLLEAMAMRS